MMLAYQDLLMTNNIIVRLELRKRYWLLAKDYKLNAPDKILLVGDRPGPSAPKDQYYHHTPFYSTKHCSGWLNTQLELEGIPEDKLVWINSANEVGLYYDPNTVKHIHAKHIIALGVRANAWLLKNNIENVIKADHPQFWKRFRNKHRYPLLDILGTLTK